MSPSQAINQDSGNVEFYTPEAIVAAARVALGGGIDLDPASCTVANRTVKAARIFTRSTDGLSRKWSGRVWMNHPFQRGKNHLWINKLVASFEAGEVTEACCITYAVTSEKWFQPLIVRPQCFLFPRTNYRAPDGTIQTGATKGSAVTYFGKNHQRFATAFAHLGCVKAAVQG